LIGAVKAKEKDGKTGRKIGTAQGERRELMEVG
jgi:hypothetical protein